MTLRMQRSRPGTMAATVFLALAGVVLAWVFIAPSVNRGESGESGILLAFFALPWIMMLPDAWLGFASGIGCIVFNAFLLYCLFGGLRAGSQESQA